MAYSDLLHRLAGAFPVLDQLAPCSGGLAHPWVRLAFASDDLKKVAASDSRHDLAVEKLAQVRESDALNRRPRHA